MACFSWMFNCVSSASCSSDDFSDVVGLGTREKGKENQVKDKTSTQSFEFDQLIHATANLKELIGEGGFGKVYKGKLQGQTVAIKMLKHDACQGQKEFVTEVLMLSMLRHRNLVNLVGFCVHGDQRLLVYEYMPNRSLECHLFNLFPDQKPLDWNTRMKIALDVARCLEYLHSLDLPVIFRDLKAANILLDNDFNAKLSDFGLAKLGPVGNNSHVSTRVMGTLGYCAPEYAMTGKLTVKSDIYTFGVVLLELITGRKAYDSNTLPRENLVKWATSLINNNPKDISKLVDPELRHYPRRYLGRATTIIQMCLRENAKTRPSINEITAELENLVSNKSSNPNST